MDNDTGQWRCRFLLHRHKPHGAGVSPGCLGIKQRYMKAESCASAMQCGVELLSRLEPVIGRRSCCDAVSILSSSCVRSSVNLLFYINMSKLLRCCAAGGILEQSPDAQLKELEVRLARSTAEWKIVIGHHPIRSDLHVSAQMPVLPHVTCQNLGS